MRSFLALLGLVGCALAALGPSAVAGPVYTVSADSGGLLLRGDLITVTANPPTGISVSTLAGQMTLQLADVASGVVQTVEVYCTDAFALLTLPGTFTRGLLSDTVTDATRLSQINALMANGTAAVNSVDSSAALQLAIWEIENETSASYDVSVGSFTAAGSLNAVALANQDIQNVLNGVWKADPDITIYQLTAPGNQSLAYATTVAVSEPATLAIVAGGLGLLLVLRARRRRSPPCAV